jgi:hypothetical protein
MPVRELTAQDATWAAELMEQRRQLYASYSPVFWRPAEDATGLHARFLRRQIASPANVALRTDHGFIIGQRQAGEGFVDDFAVDADGSWETDGADLLDAMWQRLAGETGFEALRVVTAHADEDKSRMLSSLSLELASQWWVRELDPEAPPAPEPKPTPEGQPADAPAGTPRPATRVGGTGFSGTLGPAPPVYDPGGPVLLVGRLAPEADLAVIEVEAAAIGAVLLVVPVVPVPPGSGPAGLDQPGWSVASDWYVGQPAPVS